MCDEKKMIALGEKISVLVPIISALDKTLTVTNANMVHLTEEVKTITEENQDMRKTVYGNGNPSGGLSGRMSMLEKAVAKWQETQTWVARVIIGGIILALIGAAVNYFV